MFECKYCIKECKNSNSLRNHERLCKLNPNKQFANFSNPEFHKTVIKKNSNQYIKAKELGIEYTISDETRLKLSIAGKNQVWDNKRKLNHSISMNNAVKNNPDSYTSSNVCGRVKVHLYNGEKFHGKWELEVAKWLDTNNILWKRKLPPFEYYWNNSVHLYFPDFYLPKLDKYIEVKGYETRRDRCKWSVVSNLIVIKQKEISQIRENKFALLAQR